MSTRELVDALISGDSIAIENSFNTVMSNKVSSALDGYRVELSKTMFDSQENKEQVEDDDNTNNV